jgi:membrane protease YdiL (CAAX protease family)
LIQWAIVCIAVSLPWVEMGWRLYTRARARGALACGRAGAHDVRTRVARRCYGRARVPVDEAPSPSHRRPRLRAALFVLATFVASMSGAALSAFALEAHGPATGLARFALDRALDLLVALGAVYALLVHGARRRPHELGLAVSPTTLAQGALGALVGAASVLACVAIAVAARAYAIAPAPAAQHPSAATVALYALAAVTGAAFEEVAFRVGLVGALRPAFSRTVALLAPSVPFALAHLANPHASAAGLANVVLAGAVLGALYLDPAGRPRAPSLGLCTGWHAGWNFTLAQLGIPVSGTEVPWRWLSVRPRDVLFSGGAFGIEAGAGTTVVLGALFAALAVRLARAREHGP